MFAFVLALSGLFLFSNKLITKISAQQPSDIPSDLSLDLNLAKQNPLPERNQIVNSQVQQVITVSNNGATDFVQPQDSISNKVQTESSDNANHPDQTTSEQVVTKPVATQIDESQPQPSESPVPTTTAPVPTTTDSTQNTPENTQSPSASPSVVPGTNVIQPNDNAAPSDNSTNPDLPAPTPTSSESAPTSQPAADTNSQPQNVPLESQPQEPAPADNSIPAPDQSVQGVSTQTGLFQQLKGLFMRILKGK